MRFITLLVLLAAIASPAGAADTADLSQHSPIEASLEGWMQQISMAGPMLGSDAVTLVSEDSYAQRRPRVYVRPRYRRSPVSVIPMTAQFHVGFFDPFNEFSTGFNGGFRVGPRLNPYVMVGLDVDWWHRSQSTVLDLGEVRVPGSVAHQKLILSETAANLIPFLFFAQVNIDANATMSPYAGFGMGYEWLWLAANDYITGESFDEIFGGFAWQVWGGASFQLDPQMSLNAEVFFNVGEVGSDVDVFIEGYGPVTVRDVIKVNGIGARFGLCWQF